MKRSIIAMLLAVLAIATQGQYNRKGNVRFALGVDLGAHATEYEQTLRILGIPIQQRSTGGAATLTVPVSVHYGFADLFSLGFYVEAGRYVDSVDTRNNRIRLIGLEPRFHLVNTDRFAWMAGLRMGATRLSIDDPQGLGAPKSLFSGAHVGLNTGVGFLFTEGVGLDLHLHLLGNSLPLQEYELFGQAVGREVYEGTLRANGVLLQLGLHVRL
jgi:hypothetical protein